MFCNHCGKQVPEGARFCGNCGNPIAQNSAQSYQPQGTAQQPPFYQAPTQQEIPYTAPVDKSSQYQVPPYQQSQYPPQQPPYQQSQYQVPQYQPSQYPPSQSGNPVQPTPAGDKKKLLIGAVAAVAVVLVLLVSLFGDKGKDTAQESKAKQDSGKQTIAVIEEEEEKETTPPTEAAPKSAVEQYPAGKLRFDKDGFFMGYDAFAELMQHAMDQEELPFTLADPIPVMEGTKMHYGIKYGSKQIGYMILEEQNGRVIQASVTYDIQNDDTLDDQGIDAVLCLLVAGHGNMAERWSELQGKEPLATRDDYIIYQYNLDGMKASITMRSTSVFLSLKMDQ